jgi:hypothetical protein
MISDLLMIIPNFPIAVVNSYYGDWIFSKNGCYFEFKILIYSKVFFFSFLVCNFYAMCGSLSGFVNIATLTLISIERLIVIKKPFDVLKINIPQIICKLHYLYL